MAAYAKQLEVAEVAYAAIDEVNRTVAGKYASNVGAIICRQ